MTTFDYNYQYSFRFCFLIQIWHPAEDQQQPLFAQGKNTEEHAVVVVVK